MIRFRQLLICVISVNAFLLSAQDVGKVIIRNGKDSYPKFIASLNGIRLSNDYGSSVAFDYLDEYSYKINILQSGSKNTLTFMVYSAPNYVCTYVINKDSFGNYLFTQESRVLMNDTTASLPATAHTASTSTANAVVPGQVIDEADYFDIVRTLKKETLEKNRLDMAKTFFADKWLLASMVKDALKMFNVENNRLAFAKFAYNRTVDKQNYFKVYDSFTLSNSKKVMTEFMKTNP